MLMGAPLALVLLVNLFVPGATAVDQLRAALLTSLCGLLWGMHLLGRRIGAFVTLPPTRPASRSMASRSAEAV